MSMYGTLLWAPPSKSMANFGVLDFIMNHLIWIAIMYHKHYHFNSHSNYWRVFAIDITLLRSLDVFHGTKPQGKHISSLISGSPIYRWHSCCILQSLR